MASLMPSVPYAVRSAAAGESAARALRRPRVRPAAIAFQTVAARLSARCGATWRGCLAVAGARALDQAAASPGHPVPAFAAAHIDGQPQRRHCDAVQPVWRDLVM